MKKAIFGLVGAGALLLVLSQFLPLFHTHVSSQSAAVGSGTVGSAHAYTVLVLGLLAAFLGYGVYTVASRFTLALVGLLGLTCLAIALGHDLQDSRASGLRLIGPHYETATNVIAVGLYVEILGALLLLVAVVLGFVLGVPSGALTLRPPRAPKPMRDSTGQRARPRSET